MAITTTAEYKSYAGISASTWDTRIGTLVTSVEAAVARYCQRTFEQATFTEKFSGTDSAVLIVSNPPIASITSIKVYANPTDSPTALDSSLYTFETDDSGVISYEPAYRVRFYRDTFNAIEGPEFGDVPAFPEGFRNIQVIYVGGYASGSMPADLKLAIWKAIDAMFDQTGKDLSLNSETLGNYSYTRGGGGADQMESLMPKLFKQFRRRSL